MADEEDNFNEGDEEEDEEEEESQEDKEERFFAACKANRYEEVSTLLQQGICANKRDARGWTALHWACTMGYDGVVAEILEHADEDYNEYKIEAVRDARNRNYTQAYFHHCTKPMNSPIHWAIFKRFPNVVARLLLANFSHEVADEDGNTPLHLACTANLYHVAEMLLSREADPRQSNKIGNTCVQVCVSPELKDLIQRAEDHWIAHGQTYYCSASKQFYPCGPNSGNKFVNEFRFLPQGSWSHEQVEPVRYCKEFAVRLKNTEAVLRDTMEAQDIEKLRKALMEAEAVQVEERLLASGRKVLKNLLVLEELEKTVKAVSSQRPLKHRYDMNELIKAVQHATEVLPRGGQHAIEEQSIQTAEVLLRLAKAEFNVADELKNCLQIGPRRNSPPPEEVCPPS